MSFLLLWDLKASLKKGNFSKSVRRIYYLGTNQVLLLELFPIEFGLVSFEEDHLKLYHLIESLGNTKIERFKQEYRKDIVQIISDIIVIKDKYKISYNEDLILIEKYKS
jgi:hypothetical protein